MTRSVKKFHRKSDLMPSECSMDSVVRSVRENGYRRAFDVLMEAQHYWNQMDEFRKSRERNNNYTFGKQWNDLITVDGVTMTEEEYIKRQGNIPLTNNQIRRLVHAGVGVFRSQGKEPTCFARDRSEQEYGETMTTLLQYVMQVNQMSELNARSFEEYLISAFVVHKKTFGWRDGHLDCWTQKVDTNQVFIDNHMRDVRGWDVKCIGEIHDISWGELVNEFSHSPEDYRRLKDIYKWADNKGYVVSAAESFGYSRSQNYDFLLTNEPGRCRVIEVWRKEQKPRYRCHDLQNGEIFKIDEEDYLHEVVRVNEERMRMGLSVGMPEDDIPLINAEWFVDDYWYFYFLSPFGHILHEGETPYEHGSHPYVFKAYPFVNGEIHSMVSDVIDQQRYTNRLITLYDWVIRSSAKGALLVPEDCLPSGVSIEDFAENWAQVNGVILYKPSKSGRVPEQVASNSTNIGVGELLNLQLRFFEEISGITGALQGKAGFSGQSAAHYNMQTQNATTTLLDLLDSFSSFIIEGAYKDVKNIQQYYDDKRIVNIVGVKGNKFNPDPQKIRDVAFDLNITESTSTPTYRHMSNEYLMQLFQMQAINLEQLLEHSTLPFADELLQSVKSQKEQLERGEMPSGIPPELMEKAQQGVNMQAVDAMARRG
jgi:hypothetical protein